MYQSVDVCCGSSSSTCSSNSTSTMACGRILDRFTDPVDRLAGFRHRFQGTLVLPVRDDFQACRWRGHLQRSRQPVLGGGALVDGDLRHDPQFAGRAVVGEAADDHRIAGPEPDEQQQRAHRGDGREQQTTPSAPAIPRLGFGRERLWFNHRLGPSVHRRIHPRGRRRPAAWQPPRHVPSLSATTATRLPSALPGRGVRHRAAGPAPDLMLGRSQRRRQPDSGSAGHRRQGNCPSTTTA